ncbi:hypothetical protein M378DRAFT_129101 [Amanita muscaria Koide BX008]|uniref:Uncharacterized protein n=1 Tax=Amanita muscaria (strain Koide BX008) TaxID=946122 RepID=A0A0C2T6G8_AMAMK|nr:hypothetical protein M378DRAFT_129101 [Amanita muscaria Koide BX008]
MATLTISADLIHKTYGAQLIGTLVATLYVSSFFCYLDTQTFHYQYSLSGTNTLQTIVYFRVYHDDVMRLKALVCPRCSRRDWLIYSSGLDIIHTAFIWSNLWFYLIINFGQVSGINAVPK